MVSLGIGCGLGAGLFQSLSYVCIRLFNKRHNDNIITTDTRLENIQL